MGRASRRAKLARVCVHVRCSVAEARGRGRGSRWCTRALGRSGSHVRCALEIFIFAPGLKRALNTHHFVKSYSRAT